MVLDTATRDLVQFCATEGDADCWKGVDYFVEKRASYEAGCDIEHNRAGEPEACTALNELEMFVRQQMSAGSVKSLYNNLRIMQRAEERRLAREQAAAAEQAQPHGAAAVPADAVAGLTEAEIRRRAQLIRLFHSIDRNGDGLIGLAELRDALEGLGAAPTEGDMCAIADAMGDGEGRPGLGLEEFIDVLEASRLPDGPVGHQDVEAVLGTAFLRHSSHLHGAGHHGPANPADHIH